MKKLYLILTRYDSFQNEDDVSIFWFLRAGWSLMRFFNLAGARKPR